MKLYSLAILALFLTSACYREANIKLPPQENKLVVSCFISPADTMVSATVRYSLPKYGGQTQASSFNDDLKNAKVIISDGLRSAQLVFDEDLFFYYASAKQFPITAGKTYYLKISTPDGKEVSASTSVPNNPPQVRSIDIVKTKDTQGDLAVNLNVMVDDVAGQTDYIAMGGRMLIAVKNNTFFPVDTSDHGGVTLDFFDNDEKTSRSSYFYQQSNDFSIYGDTITYAAANLAVVNCSKEFYLYNQSATLAGYNGGNPFSDPILVYSNISGGFGCFGGYFGVYPYRKVR